MYSLKAFSAIIAIGILTALASGQQGGPACDAIAYDFSAFNGTLDYQSVVHYDFKMSGCKMQSVTVNSPIAPLDQGLTAVFRGPIRLKQFAVYNNSPLLSDKGASEKAHHARHLHGAGHRHLHKKKVGKRGCGDMVTATIDGQVVSFVDNWDCFSTATDTGLASSSASTVSKNQVESEDSTVKASIASLAAPAPPASGSQQNADNSGPSGAWNQVAYFSAESKSAKNVTFLYPVMYGNTDYLPSSGATGASPASGPQILSDVLVEDNSRFYVASSIKMTQTAAPQNKAYHGFSGSKIFLVEMQMPLSGNRGSGSDPDQPAFWLLNEQLPNTNEDADCNCWASGCGEFDIHEILSPGAMVGYSSLHMGEQYCGGATNGLQRATAGGQKLAVILKAGDSSADSVVRIVQLDPDYQFKESISEDDYQSWVSRRVTGGQIGSLEFGSECPDPYTINFKRT